MITNNPLFDEYPQPDESPRPRWAINAESLMESLLNRSPITPRRIITPVFREPSGSIENPTNVPDGPPAPFDRQALFQAVDMLNDKERQRLAEIDAKMRQWLADAIARRLERLQRLGL
jgi:hypothetical protein